MKLDRYDTGVPKFRVFRHVEHPEDGAPPRGVRSFSTDEGEAYMEVDPWECFVLKRRDTIARFMLAFGSVAAKMLGDDEYGDHLFRLGREWRTRTARLNDGKMPD